MELETFSEVKLIAKEKWHEYKAAAKATKNPVYKDLQKVYNQVKGGKKIIDISKVIQKGGVHDNGSPKLAIAQALSKIVFCEVHKSGNVNFINRAGRWGGADQLTAADVSIKACLPETKMFDGAPNYSSLKLKAPVPLVPPKYLPNRLTADYYILWEVDVWEMVPPTDPWLLKRITNNLFVALHGWDLSPLEKAVMKGRMH